MKRRKRDRPGGASPVEEVSAHPAAQPDAPAVPIAGIGASAGGLEALREFFAAMPPDSGMAFVIVQHLDPSYESRTAEIIAKHTTMPVAEAAEGMAVQANHVYTNPANRYVALHHGTLSLSEQVRQEGVRKPIDFLLTSLAEDCRDRAIGLILSGSSGSDGVQGVRAIRAAGGMSMAQEPHSARFPEMPRSIVAAGLADFVLPVEQMPKALMGYVRSVRAEAPGEEGASAGAAADELESILNLLRLRTRSDYRHYKKATLLRRIRRHMGLRQSANMAAYLKLLQEDPQELLRLAQDMLISVSAFFRDSEAFEELRRTAITLLAEGRDSDVPLRAWVPACATGEEAYSIAMLLLEATADAGKNSPVQVFASDVDEHALETARAGTYPAAIADDVSPERLKKFFLRNDDNWQVNKRLRATVVFSRHNLLTDPPFSKLDLVSCRNILIYLEPLAQRKVLRLFSFALTPGGYLFLGKSEGVAGLEEELFEAVSMQKRIFRLVRADRRVAGEFPLYAAGQPPAFVPRGRPNPLGQALADANQEALLRHFHSSSVLIDPKGRILYFHGQTEKYLGHPKGQASLNLLDLTEGLLSAKLRRAIGDALARNEVVVIPHVPMPRVNGKPATLTLLPVALPALGDRVLAVIFEDAEPAQRPAVAPLSVKDESLVAQLEAEVRALRNELRSDAEEYGSANEELKAANEEVTSMNEELQSANEELEASKEELQSLNEELTTLNSQLGETVAELTAVNNDLANLINATQIATLFLDRQLRIRRFTPRATELLNLIPSDVGRPIGHITQNFTGGNLAGDSQKVLADLSTTETDVRTREGRWFTIRILPYRTLDDRIDGVVVTFSDITRLKEAERRLQNESEYAQRIVETARDPLVVLDGELRLLSANKAFYDMLRSAPAETAGKRITDLAGGNWGGPRLRELLQEVIPKRAPFNDFEVECDTPQGGRRTMLLNARRMAGIEGERILLAIEDVTERKKAGEKIRALNASLEKRAEQLRYLASDLARTEQRERERLARVLHDDLQQLLVGAQFHLSRLRAQTLGTASSKAAEQVASLIQQSLDSSRSLTAELSPTILYEAGLDAALPWLARQLKAKHGLEVRTEINATVPQDEEGVVIILFQAVRELLFNIVKHSGAKEAVVSLDRLDGNEVRIVVSDQGAGFDSLRLEAEGPSKTGMGLFGMRERIQHMGGTVVIESAPGRGTHVILTARVQAPEEAPPAARAEGESAVPASLAPSGTGRRKIRVLLVDDHAIVRQGLAGILKQEPDIEVVGEAADGAQAVAEAAHLRPDVVIMDLSMPAMNGIEATRLIHEAQPGVRIIGLSMYEEADRAEAMREAGASAYLSKGGPPQELLAAIRAGGGQKE